MKIKDIGDICGLECPLFDDQVCGTEHGGHCFTFDDEMEIDDAVKRISIVGESEMTIKEFTIEAVSGLALLIMLGLMVLLILTSG